MFEKGTKVRIIPPEEKLHPGWGGLQQIHANEIHTVKEVFDTENGNYYLLSNLTGVWAEEILDDQNRKRADRV